MTKVQKWELTLGERAMAELWFDSYETPWITVRVKAGPGFDRFRSYFAQEDDWPDEGDRGFESVLDEVTMLGGFRLATEGEAERREFTLVNLDAKVGAEPEFANLRF